MFNDSSALALKSAIVSFDPQRAGMPFGGSGQSGRGSAAHFMPPLCKGRWTPKAAGGVVNAFAGWIFAITRGGGSCFYQDLWYNDAEHHENMAGAEKKKSGVVTSGRGRNCALALAEPDGSESMRKRIYEVIEIAREDDRASAIYDSSMMAIIILSLVPLAFKETNTVFAAINYVSAVCFIFDYFLRLLTADYKLKRGAASFFLYPFTPMAIIDLLAILPVFTAVFSGMRLMKLLRLFRTFRVFRSFKVLRYAKSMQIIAEVIREQRAPLLAVCSFAAGYILIAALIVFNVEPDTFSNFFEAVYWATVSLTTVGYGDIYPVTTAGRIVTMASSFVGIAIVALPAGIITAGYMDRIHRR